MCWYSSNIPVFGVNKFKLFVLENGSSNVEGHLQQVSHTRLHYLLAQFQLQFLFPELIILMVQQVQAQDKDLVLPC